ncbi:MAG: type II toxin-antitoxin system RelE/ParE family toxin [Chloroflexi bacterium]|nr:type II toxin-antitoxin system RelE/ParE family toxin [Chloroflexota bacterium]
MTMQYALKLHRDIEKQLARIPSKQRERLIHTMRSLREDPRPQGCVKLDDALYRVREGQYRVIYAVFDDEVIVVVCKVARRTEATCRDVQELLQRARRELQK